MIEETGTVLRSSGGKASVRMNPKEECGSCGGCASYESGHFMIAAADDFIGTRPGDTVKIVNQISPARAGFLLYFLPLVAFSVGYIAGTTAFRAMGVSIADGWAILVGFALVAMTYTIIFLRQKRATRKGINSMRIERLIRTPSRRRL